MLASPGLISAWVQNTGAIAIDGLEIRRTGNRLLSSTADAIHMVDNPAKVIIKNCYMEGMADDAINTRSTAFIITAVSSSKRFTFGGQGVPNFLTGQKLQIVSSSTQLAKGHAHITSLTKSDNGYITVSIDQAVEGVKAGDLVFNVAFAAPNLVVKNNLFSYFRGMFRIRSSGALFLDNKIENAENARVFISADIAKSWMEGPSLLNSLSGVYFNNNSIQDGYINLLELNYKNTGIPTLMGENSLKIHPLVFDGEFYRLLYKDLENMNLSELQEHWLKFGINEGRQASVGFSASEYINMYSDLMKAFGTSNLSAAILHFIYSGAVEEQRQGSFRGSPLVYDPATYRILNDDISGMTLTQLGSHWIKHGIKEGRRAHRQFSSREYLLTYADLRNYFGNESFENAIYHYTHFGALKEGRMGTIVLDPLIFNSSHYANLNSDLKDMDELALTSHWIKHGINEGRQASEFFNSRFYLNFYPDLLKAYGPNDYHGAIIHYILQGRYEGRQRVPQ